LLEDYFKDLQNKLDTVDPLCIYNMDEIGIFFELTNDFTIEVKGKRCIGNITYGKSKERVTVMLTASSDGRLLPPLFIFKAQKPRGKSYKDDPLTGKNYPIFQNC